jgi:hypothetical protein
LTLERKLNWCFLYTLGPRCIRSEIELKWNCEKKLKNHIYLNKKKHRWEPGSSFLQCTNSKTTVLDMRRIAFFNSKSILFTYYAAHLNGNAVFWSWIDKHHKCRPQDCCIWIPIGTIYVLNWLASHLLRLSSSGELFWYIWGDQHADNICLTTNHTSICWNLWWQL